MSFMSCRILMIGLWVWCYGRTVNCIENQAIVHPHYNLISRNIYSWWQSLMRLADASRVISGKFYNSTKGNRQTHRDILDSRNSVDLMDGKHAAVASRVSQIHVRWTRRQRRSEDYVPCHYVWCDARRQWCDDVTEECGSCELLCGAGYDEACQQHCQVYLDVQQLRAETELLAVTESDTLSSETTTPSETQRTETEIRGYRGVVVGMGVVAIVSMLSVLIIIVIYVRVKSVSRDDTSRQTEVMEQAEQAEQADRKICSDPFITRMQDLPVYQQQEFLLDTKISAV